jgi:hypothetical protein
MRTWVCIAGGLIGVLATSAVRAQSCDGIWLPGGEVRGVSGTVNAECAWDPDGAGPAGEILIVGGDFTAAGGLRANRIATWDGATWGTLGSGFDGTVNAATVFDGKLIVAGSFQLAGEMEIKGIAAWDGTQWQPVGGGVSGSVYAMAVSGGLLYVAGDFTAAGGVAAGCVAAWDGTEWSACGSGFTGGVRQLCAYEGSVVASGFQIAWSDQNLKSLARWDGTQWVGLGSGLTNSGSALTVQVAAMHQWGNELVVAGRFTNAGGVAASNCAAWNGLTWRAVGAGLSANTTSRSSLVVYDGKLHAVGRFGSVAIYRLDGDQWQRVSTVITAITDTVATLFQARIMVGGRFSMAYGGPKGVEPFENIASWDGEWAALGNGMASGGWDSAVVGDRFFMTGAFAELPGGGGTPLAIGQWNGSTWSPLSTLWENSTATVTTLAAAGSDLLASGSRIEGNLLWWHVASWDGNEWFHISGQILGTIRALAYYQGDVIVAGSISSIDGMPMNRIARWDGAAWHPLGDGVNGDVLALLVKGDELIAAGRFTQAGGAGATRVARWDGQNWHAMGAGIDDATSGVSVNALAMHQGQIVAGGTFVTIGNQPTPGVAIWDGAAWHAVGDTVFSATVNALASLNGDLVAAGNFFGDLSNIARWDGAAWKPLRAGLNGTVSMLAVFHGELVAGGSFTTADLGPSAHFARWTDDPTPWVAVSPESKPVNEGRTLTLSAAVASGYANVSYQWKRNGAGIVDGSGGASTGGGTVSGASGVLASPSDGSLITLTIAGVQASDAGNYTIEFDNTCNVSMSAVGAVTVNTCPGDLNADGFVNDTDFELFASAYNLLLCEDAGMPVGCLSDLNGDGVVDDIDFQLFVVAYDALVCE